MTTRNYFFLLTLLLPVTTLAGTHVNRYEMQPVWSIDAEHGEDVVFGQIEDVLIDTENTVYVLDTQLNHIQVFSAGGQHLRTIGREGDGPGEFRTPASLVMMPDSTLGVVSKQFGRITKIDPRSGAPRGQLKLTGEDNSLIQIGRVMSLPSKGQPAAIAAVVREPTPPAGDRFRFQMWTYLAIFPAGEGLGPVAPQVRLMTVGEVSGRDLEEENYYSLWQPWATDSMGRVIASPYWSTYQLNTFGPGGDLLQSHTRPFPQRHRTTLEKERFLNYLWGGVSPADYGVELVASKVEAVIREIYPRSTGEVWVRTNNAGNRNSEGVFLELDVIGPDGEQQGQVQLIGAGDESIDRTYFGHEGLMVVTHGAERFIRSARGRLDTGAHHNLVLAAYRLVRIPENASHSTSAR